ncbi:hypothetical protein ACHAXT_009105 [Thalassiosira profunda]
MQDGLSVELERADDPWQLWGSSDSFFSASDRNAHDLDDLLGEKGYENPCSKNTSEASIDEAASPPPAHAASALLPR